MIGKFRRLAGLRRLLSVEARIAALEDQGKSLHNLLHERSVALNKRSDALKEHSDRLQKQVDGLKDNRTRLQDRNRELQKQINVLQGQVSALLRQFETRLEHTIEHLDALKSSFEVPQELVEEFSEWKARNPLPERPLISVCVATYNRARLLTERCIPSVLSQTYRDLELIVVGDGCTDETEEMAAEIDDPRLAFINLTQRSSYPEELWRRWMVAGTPAMNQALSMANGDFITHLDDDDEYVPDRLEKLVEFATTNRCDFVWHPFWVEDAEGNWWLNEASSFTHGQVTTSSTFYRSWFKKITWDIDAHRLMEPGDWNRLRRIKYIGPTMLRYPEPLLRHYRERAQGR
jgi:FtsZ-binding cell division protein ZapB